MNLLFDNLFIFELANNHQGLLEHAEYIIDKISVLVSKYKINAAVKLQYRDLDTFIHPDFKERDDVKHIPRFLQTRMSEDDFFSLVSKIKQADILACVTPFDENSVDLCVKHGVDIIKVASCSATDYPLLEKIVLTKKPVIISTGGKYFWEMDNIYNFFTHRNAEFALLHCVSLYPAENSHIQLNCIEKMINRYPNVPIGYSGHESPENMLIPQMAFAKGAGLFERHIGHETNKIHLNAYSTEVDKAEAWVEAVLAAKEICGDKNKKYIEDSELKSINELSRGVYASKNIKIGEKISGNDVFFAMPCQDRQLQSGQFAESIIATKDYSVNEAIFEKSPKVSNGIRNIIHDVKGMLYEAKIVIGSEFVVELSHHYGIDHFREYGATIVNIVNREYCKKIIIVLPGQKHPIHYHKSKEETFQVLSGSLHLELKNEEVDISTGRIFTVEREMEHGFSSVHGCIFEEVSTTHVKMDSFYNDTAINSLSLELRKTHLKEW
jgi:N-acetylneuraminate synthase